MSWSPCEKFANALSMLSLLMLQRVYIVWTVKYMYYVIELVNVVVAVGLCLCVCDTRFVCVCVLILVARTLT